MKVFLIAGAKRSGKDTFGELLQIEFEKIGKRVERHSFASPMKSIISKIFKISEEELEEYKNDTESIWVNNPNTGFKILTDFRQVLQTFGSEAMKPIFGDKVWVNLLNDKINKSKADIIIITDFRFPSEYELDVKPYTVKVDRELVNEDSHISENALNDFIFDVIVKNTGTIEDLRDLAKHIIELKEIN
jgi:hypothetical protein